MPHLTPEVYAMILDGTLPPRTLARALHEHLREICSTCADEWAAARALGLVPPVPEERPRELQGGAVRSAVAFSPEARRLEASARRVRSTRRQAQKELSLLLARRPERREEAIINARRRYRSRAFVELLIERGGELVRSAPRQAEHLFDLAQVSLLWAPGGLDSDWGRSLQVRAEAQRANSLRVAGDLNAAEQAFAAVRRRLAAVPLDDSTIYGEVASLEASLLWDQKRRDEAVVVLDQAVLVFQDAGDREGLARALIKRASVQREIDRFDDALAGLARARNLLDREEHTFLYLCAVVAEAPILLDLGRHEEAERVLAEAGDAFEAVQEPWWALRFRYLLGRAALGRGDLDRAELLLAEARQGFLDQGLPQDTANASLDLALVHLHQGRTAEVRRLCSETVPYFRACGLGRDALAALTLFQRSTAADAAALARLAELRRHLSGGSVARPAAGE